LALYFIYWELELFKNKDAPFVCTPNDKLAEIVSAINPQNNSTVYDLGCGDNRVLIACAKQNPNAKYLGIENSISAYTAAYINTKLVHRNKDINLKLTDYNKLNLAEATHLYIWSSNDCLNTLLVKLNTILRPGTKLVSLDFYFRDKPATEIIDLRNTGTLFGHKLYIYYF
jgi:SAM-dependent methyltransferase